MEFLERKLKNGGYEYYTNQMGEMTVSSPVRLDIDLLDGILMRVKRTGKKVEGLTIELTGEDYDGEEILVKYTPINSWKTDEEMEKEKKSLFEKVKTLLLKWYYKIKSLLD